MYFNKATNDGKAALIPSRGSLQGKPLAKFSSWTDVNCTKNYKPDTNPKDLYSSYWKRTSCGSFYNTIITKIKTHTFISTNTNFGEALRRLP